MPPKRFVLFLISLLILLGWVILAPVAERGMREGTTLNAVPNASAYGYKALYLLMGTIQERPVRFWQHSVMKLPLETLRTVWFLEPGSKLFMSGEVYAAQMQALVRNGYHLVFVLDAPSRDMETLNRWYGTTLKTTSEALPKEVLLDDIETALTSRPIQTLAFHRPPQQALRRGRHLSFRYSRPPVMAYLDKATLGHARPLVWRSDGRVMAARFAYGRGHVTVLPNSFFFKNGQLDRADNAALAVALQEQFASQAPILFEGYSNGFTENRDILTYLATGKGLFLFLALGAILVVLCLWLANRPRLSRIQRSTTDERYFTQEVFIQALGRHYANTRNWSALYQRLLTHICHEWEQRWPNLTFAQRTERIAQSPFVTVSLETLTALSTVSPAMTEDAFFQKSQALLAVQREVRHVHAATRHPAPAFSRR